MNIGCTKNSISNTGSERVVIIKNAEGYYDPTAAEAFRLEVSREDLRQQYRIEEGQTVKIKELVVSEDDRRRKNEKIIQVNIHGIYPKFVVLQYPAGYCKCMHWDEFENCRCE